MRSKLVVATLTAILSTSLAAPAALAHDGENHAAVPQAADGMGVIKAVDAKGGTVTIAHEPIAALKWPAMTMKFKVESADVLKDVTVGRKVHFIMKNVGGKPVVTQIHPL